MSKKAVKGSKPNPNIGDRTLRLESCYLDSGFRLSSEDLAAHSITLLLPDCLRRGDKMSGSLFLDPNQCTLNAFGDREACTRIASRQIEVTLVLQPLSDPQHLGRQYFQVTGDGLPPALGLIIQPQPQPQPGQRQGKGAFERCYLKLDKQVVPLYRAAGA